VFSIKLNPKKCASRVRVGKFLSFLTNERGIEANLVKVKVAAKPQDNEGCIDAHAYIRKVHVKLSANCLHSSSA